jgi:dienelactone hydrolase
MTATLMEAVQIPAGDAILDGDLRAPADARGLVVFAHGSGSSRFSSRNRAVAQSLEEHAMATLLMDLLTRDEEAVDMRTRQHRFDIRLLASRVVAATDWLQARPDISRLPLGYFGASTGAAAALIAAAERPQVARAVVSRGGRPDLAGASLRGVRVPTLMIVGGDDDVVIGLNEDAMAQMTADVELAIVPGATHLFEEPGALEEVSRLAGDWFDRHLAGRRPQHTSQH